MKNNYKIIAFGLFIGIVLGYLFFDHTSCNKKKTDTSLNIQDTVNIFRERDSLLNLNKVLIQKNDSLDDITRLNMEDINRMKLSVDKLRSKLNDKDNTINELRGKVRGTQYRYLSDDSLIIELKNKFKDIK